MTPSRFSLSRLLVVALLLAGTAVLLEARRGLELIPQRLDFSSFPRHISGWESRNLGIEPAVLEVLGPGDFLSRIYTRSDQPPLTLFLGYFSTQRTGNTIHSPKNCLPGAGWSPLEAGEVDMPTPTGGHVLVNRYVIGKGLERQLVLYWYQAHDRVVASEYWAKFYLVADAIRLNRTDGALVRIVTPVAQGESVASAEQRAITFSQHLIPVLPNYIP